MSRMQNRTAWLKTFRQWCKKHPDVMSAALRTFVGTFYEYINSDGTITYAALITRMAEDTGWSQATIRRHLRMLKAHGWLLDTNHAHEGTFQRRSVALPPDLDVAVPDGYAQVLPTGRLKTSETLREGGHPCTPSEPERGVTHAPPLHAERGVTSGPPSKKKKRGRPSGDALAGSCNRRTVSVPMKKESVSETRQQPQTVDATASEDPETRAVDHPEHRPQAEQAAYLLHFPTHCAHGVKWATVHQNITACPDCNEAGSTPIPPTVAQVKDAS